MGTIDGARYCATCLAAKTRELFPIPAKVRAPCSLCLGTCCLYDDDERPFPCVCTPGGRARANGAPDAVVRAQLVASGLFEAG